MKHYLSKLGLGGALGFVTAFFLDKDNGKRRRKLLADRTLAAFRRSGRRSGRLLHRLGADAQGMKARVTYREGEKSYDDNTLKARIESEIFRGADSPKGAVSVNVQMGVVQLRGEVKTHDEIKQLVAQVEAIPGVASVENLLHPANTPAPMHQ